jgi:DNA polymerase-3 subunit delta'
MGLPHASLLLGNAGTGKRPLAFRLAKFLLCKAEDKKTAENTSYCKVCQSCLLMDAGSHPDYFICDQEAKGKQIKVDAVRQLNEFLSKTPQISACQVVQIYPVEAMNLNASNALLKTLEEPSGETYLLLMAERLGSVLPTIRSRTQRISFHPPATEQALAWLAERMPNTSADDLAQALRQCGGGPLKAQSWLQDGLLAQDATYIKLMQAWLSGLQQLQDVSKGLAKFDLADTINWWTGLSLDIMKLGMGAEASQLSHPQQAPWLEQLVATVSRLKLLTLQQKLQEIAGRLAAGQGNYNASLLVESLLLDWQQSFSS